MPIALSTCQARIVQQAVGGTEIPSPEVGGGGRGVGADAPAATFGAHLRAVRMFFLLPQKNNIRIQRSQAARVFRAAALKRFWVLLAGQKYHPAGRRRYKLSHSFCRQPLWLISFATSPYTGEAMGRGERVRALYFSPTIYIFFIN